jgi:ABC-type antimicrobial peptide transport system permease subunit
VSQRVKEIGIRIALGAQLSNILGVIMKEGMTLVAIGLAFGLAVALAMSNSLRAFLFHVAPAGPLTLAGVAAACIAFYIYRLCEQPKSLRQLLCATNDRLSDPDVLQFLP